MRVKNEKRRRRRSLMPKQAVQSQWWILGITWIGEDKEFVMRAKFQSFFCGDYAPGHRCGPRQKWWLKIQADLSYLSNNKVSYMLGDCDKSFGRICNVGRTLSAKSCMMWKCVTLNAFLQLLFLQYIQIFSFVQKAKWSSIIKSQF